MGSSAKSHTYDVLRNRAREADAQVVNVHLDGRLSRREGHLLHPVGHAQRGLRRSSCSPQPTALQTAAEAVLDVGIIKPSGRFQETSQDVLV